MSARTSRSVVVLGMMTKMPVPGVVWQTVHYLVGLRRLGYDVTYVEAHARTPSMFVRGTHDAGTRRAAAYVADVLGDFDLDDRWAFHALHHDGSCLGMSAGELADAYRSADLILNLCGGTQPRPEHVDTGRLVLVVTDPVQIEIELWQGRAETRAFLDAHAALFTFGENYGKPGCLLPVSPDYDLIPTRQPVLLDAWAHDRPAGPAYTTVANWHQPFRNLRYQGETYFWSKDREFRKFLDLPGRSGCRLELALASYEPEDRRLLEEHGWIVRDADGFGLASEPYRGYVQGSRGEFTVAKDQNVRLRSGWFSDRSATYLAAGRPVVTQDTGFGEVLPTGAGLFAVSDRDEAAAALATVEADYDGARAAALDVAREYFDYRIVLPKMLADAGLEGPARRLRAFGDGGARAAGDPAGEAVAEAAPRVARTPLPDDLVLEPRSRRPLRLEERTERLLDQRPIPAASAAPDRGGREPSVPVSVVVVTHGKLPLTRLCVESLLAHTRHPDWELIVVDNASPDATPTWLKALAAAHRRVRLILNPDNEGFPAACNQGARAAQGAVLVFLNNDTVVPPGWLDRLVAPLSQPGLGAVNPVTNRIGTPAEVAGGDPGTYGAFLRRAEARARDRAGELRPTRMLALFCLALRRDVWERVGPLDEGFDTGLFEDDDYSVRLARAGYDLACVEGVLVHHFGEASFGDLVPDGRYGELYRRNQRRFEAKWGVDALPREAASDPAYARLVDRVRSAVEERVPARATVAVVSRGDAGLLDLGDATGWHFPRTDDGVYAGHYPADGADAVAQLEGARRGGATHFLVPRPGFWWLDHYDDLRRHLDASCTLVARSDDLVLYRLDGTADTGGVPTGGAPRAHVAPAADAAARGTAPGAAQATAAASHPRAGSEPRPRPGPAARVRRPRPVFIIGSPRSGTSVLTWALGQHPDLYPLEETVWFGRFHAGALQAHRIGSSRGEFSQLSAMGIERDEFMATLGDAIDAMILRHRSWPATPVPTDQAYARARTPDDPKRRWIDGTPENSFHVEGLAELFPGASFIHLVREPHLVARSLRRFHTIGGRRHTMDEGYRKWIAHVGACLEAERALGPDRVVRVLHRDLVAAPEGVLRTCLDFLGEAYTAHCLLPLRERINSSGGATLPDDDDGKADEPDPEVRAEARALADVVFGDGGDGASGGDRGDDTPADTGGIGHSGDGGHARSDTPAPGAGHEGAA